MPYCHNPVGESATENGHVYVDAVDEAFQRQRRNRGGVRPQVRPRRRLNDIAVRQMRLVEKQQRILAKALTSNPATKCDKCGRREEIPAKDVPAIVTASNDVTNQIDKLARSIREGHKAEREAMSGLTAEELDIVFRDQLPRCAPGMPMDQRKTIVTLWFGHEVAEVLCKP